MKKYEQNNKVSSQYFRDVQSCFPPENLISEPKIHTKINVRSNKFHYYVYTFLLIQSKKTQ